MKIQTSRQTSREAACVAQGTAPKDPLEAPAPRQHLDTQKGEATTCFTQMATFAPYRIIWCGPPNSNIRTLSDNLVWSTTWLQVPVSWLIHHVGAGGDDGGDAGAGPVRGGLSAGLHQLPQAVQDQLYGAQARFFEDELPQTRGRSHEDRSGLLGMASGAANQNASQFYITTRAEDMAYLDEQHTIFGEVAEGMDVLDTINSLFVDKDYRPYQDVRIKHTYVLDDPFPDPKGLDELIPPASPTRERPEEEQVEPRLAADEKLDENEGRTEQEIEKAVREKEAKSRAVVLEMIGDLPDADVKPPEEVLFVCKLNPVTESADLDMAFCRFGPCKSEVIRDQKTGDSLCFAFVEFTDRRHCEEAYFKMNNVLLDDRRIKVDFSQSVSKLWNKVKRRPWEKTSKRDGDEYAGGRRGGRGGKSSGGGRRELAGDLRLKYRGGADDFKLVEEEEAVVSSRRSKPASACEERLIAEIVAAVSGLVVVGAQVATVIEDAVAEAGIAYDAVGVAVAAQVAVAENLGTVIESMIVITALAGNVDVQANDKVTIFDS
ncbi:unnamed protein product [Phytophthora lilii]|uniref:Peptidyl-prolyl cis-trans isomerase n=1 Tax=Phytophthora lilii TaxID=2077276 RepID=A0A9W7CTD0_9STRA|nr:unnamed protein product [Phytophthora lilii]